MPDHMFSPLAYVMASLASLKKYEKTPEYKMQRIQTLERHNNTLEHDSKRLNRMMHTAISRGDKKKALKFCNKLALKAKTIDNNVKEIISLCDPDATV